MSAAPAWALPAIPPRTEWVAATGDWHAAVNWDNGEPSADDWAVVNRGEARFSTPAVSNWLTIGETGGVGAVVGSADLTATGVVSIGTASGTGTDHVQIGSGSLRIAGGDLRINPMPPEANFIIPGELVVGNGGGTGTRTSFSGVGLLEVQDGDVISPGGVRVGTVGGTGTNTRLSGTGTLRLTDGQLQAVGALMVGTASGTGSADGTALGEMLVENGSVHVRAGLFDLPGNVSIGVAGGTGQFDGQATGVLTLDHADLTAAQISIGITSPISGASGASDGKLIVRDGNVSMTSMQIGMSLSNGGPAAGRLEQHRGRTTGESLDLGADGVLVLGIAGELPAVQYGQVHIMRAALSGRVEARFIDGYLPKDGDVFDLVTAGAITGGYSVTVAGINPADYPNLRIVKTPQVVRLQFVPEPAAWGLAALAIATGALRRRALARWA
jgi:hypothetical protein